MRLSFSSLIYLIKSSRCCYRFKSFSFLRNSTCSYFSFLTACFRACACNYPAIFCSRIMSSCIYLSFFSFAASLAFRAASCIWASARAFYRLDLSCWFFSSASYFASSICAAYCFFWVCYSCLRNLTAIISSAFFLVSSIFFQVCQQQGQHSAAYLSLFHLEQSNPVGEQLHVFWRIFLSYSLFCQRPAHCPWGASFILALFFAHSYV